MKSILAVASSALCLFASTATASYSNNVRITTMNDIKNVKNKVDQLTTNIQNWNHTLEDALYSIDMPAEAIATYLGNITTDLKKTPTTFTIDEAFRIAGSVQDLAYSVNNSVAALNKNVQEFTKLAFTLIVVNDLGLLYNATEIFANQLISYVQTELRPVADVLKEQAIDSIQQGLDCINNPNNTVACNTAMIDPEKTHKEALRWGAIRPDGSPIA